jgi:predicted amidohydrolase
MQIALAQLDVRLGDLEGNARRARDAIAESRAGGAELVVFPELFLCGYALAGVVGETTRDAAAVASLAPDSTAAVLGFHERSGSETYNSAVYAAGGVPVHVQRKLYLVDYPPFDEGVLFTAGSELRAFDTPHGRLAVLICNDAWQPFLPFLAVRDGAQVLLMPASSSRAVPEAEEYWRELTRFYARMLQCYVVFVNRVGTEAGFVYWGGSHVVDPLGEIVAEAPVAVETLLLAEIDLGRVEERRRELPLLGEPRLALIQAELARLVATHERLR